MHSGALKRPKKAKAAEAKEKKGGRVGSLRLQDENRAAASREDGVESEDDEEVFFGEVHTPERARAAKLKNRRRTMLKISAAEVRRCGWAGWRIRRGSEGGGGLRAKGRGSKAERAQGREGTAQNLTAETRLSSRSATQNGQGRHASSLDTPGV